MVQGAVCICRDREVLQEPKRSLEVPAAMVMNTTSWSCQTASRIIMPFSAKSRFLTKNKMLCMYYICLFPCVCVFDVIIHSIHITEICSTLYIDVLIVHRVMFEKAQSSKCSSAQPPRWKASTAFRAASSPTASAATPFRPMESPPKQHPDVVMMASTKPQATPSSLGRSP